MSIRSVLTLPPSRRAAALVVAIGASLLLLLISGAVNREATAASPRYEPPPWPYQELAPEWRWQPPRAEYEHMFRDRGDDARRLDWIREGRR